VQGTHHALNIMPQVALRGFGRLAAPAQDEQKHLIVLFHQGIFQRAVTLAHIGGWYACSDSTPTQAVKENTSLLPSRLAEGGVLVG
jgi:hypothetical protein